MERILKTVLGPPERRLLDWLCRHIPSAVSSNMMTALGVAGAALAGWGYAMSANSAAWLWLAILGLALNWLGDSLDGSLARYRRCERPKYGFFLDHATDTFAMGLVMVGIGLSPHVNLATALAALAAYYLMTILAMANLVATGVFRISFAGLGPTEIRAVIALCTAAVIFLPVPKFMWGAARVTLYDAIMAVVTVLLIAAGALFTLTTARLLAKVDPPRGDD